MVKKVFLFVLVFYGYQLLAQNKLKQGKIMFEIMYKNIPPSMVMQQSMLPKNAVFYFKDSLTRIEMGIANQGKNVTIYNHHNGNIFILLNLYNQKFALVKHDSDLAALKKEYKTDTATITDEKIEIFENITKSIAGYKCTKAIISKKVSGITRENECWFTPELPSYNLTNNDEFKKIKGFLMEYTATERGITTTFKARNVVAVPVEDWLFEIPSSYKVLTEQELMRLLNYYQSQQPNGEY